MKLYNLFRRVFPSWRSVEPFRSMDPKSLPIDSILHSTYVACGQDFLRRAVEGAVIGALPGLYFLHGSRWRSFGTAVLCGISFGVGRATCECSSAMENAMELIRLSSGDMHILVDHEHLIHKKDADEISESAALEAQSHHETQEPTKREIGSETRDDDDGEDKTK
eukprot:TRINITY_DN7620_c0_g1_i1.p1 TRINITY_DN7620_c0_g1~~TRINITY_DN7620_c0_g1_i1.p1  ORF type:complete len:165 (-),score=54.40 TRINITY_DN7620_c0_g1_i1:4-498(-)